MAREKTKAAPSKPPRTPFLQNKWVLRGLLLAIALAAFGNSFGLGLAFDSNLVVNADKRVHEVTAQNLALIWNHDYWWPTPADLLYRPLTTTSYLFNYAVLANSANPAGYHWLNFLLHFANVCLAFEIALLLLGSIWPAFFAAAIWAVHPVNVESVTNVAGRADLLAGLAVLGALLVYARWTRWRVLPASCVMFGLAFLGAFSKESSAVLLGLMLLWDLFQPDDWRRDWRLRAMAYVAVTVPLLLMLWMRYRVFAAQPWPAFVFVNNSLASAGFLASRFTAVKVLGLDLLLLVFPWRLSSDYSYNQIPVSGATDPWAWGGLVVVLAILAYAVAHYRRDRLIFWATGFAALTLLPTANLLFPISSIMAERFLYLPAFAFAVALSSLVWRMREHGTAVALLVVVGLLFAVRTYARNSDWQDNLTLFNEDVKTAPGSYRTHDFLARALFAAGNSNIDRVVQEGEIACAFLNTLPPRDQLDQTLAQLGLYYGTKGDLAGGASVPEGRSWFSKSLTVMLRAREVSMAAEEAFRTTQVAHGRRVEARLAYQPLYRDLGALYTRLGLQAEAIEAYRYGRNIDPSASVFYTYLAARYKAIGRPEMALVMDTERMLVEGGRPSTSTPELKTAACAAAADLSQAYTEALHPARSAEMRRRAAREFGCP